LATTEPARVVVVDGTLPPDALAAEVLADIRALLAGTASEAAG
jgi:hypothetical protein